MDAWHFIFEEAAGTWTWRKISASGESLSESDFSFQSFNVCVEDAARAGYLPDMPYRRVRASDFAAEKGHPLHARTERRRATRARPGASAVEKDR